MPPHGGRRLYRGIRLPHGDRAMTALSRGLLGRPAPRDVTTSRGAPGIPRGALRCLRGQAGAVRRCSILARSAQQQPRLCDCCRFLFDGVRGRRRGGTLEPWVGLGPGNLARPRVPSSRRRAIAGLEIPVTPGRASPTARCSPGAATMAGPGARRGTAPGRAPTRGVGGGTSAPRRRRCTRPRPWGASLPAAPCGVPATP